MKSATVKMKKVNYVRATINESIDAFPLDGCINPVFQNLGDAPVIIDGMLLDKEESFPIHTNGLEIDKGNNVSIIFQSETAKNLHFRCLRASEDKCNQ